MHTHTAKTTAARPLIASRPRLRFIVGAPDGSGGGAPTPGTPESGGTSGGSPDPAVDDAGQQLGYPKDTPTAEMTDTQRAAYFRHQSRKQEERNTTLQKQLDALGDVSELVKLRDTLKGIGLTDDEKTQQDALDQARQEGENIGASKAQAVAVTATIRMNLALAGVTDADAIKTSVDTLMGIVDVEKLLTDDGTPDEETIAKIIAPYLPVADVQPHHSYTQSLRAGRKGGSKAGSVEAATERYRDRYRKPAK